jgi:hypothetical protein
MKLSRVDTKTPRLVLRSAAVTRSPAPIPVRPQWPARSSDGRYLERAAFAYARFAAMSSSERMRFNSDIARLCKELWPDDTTTPALITRAASLAIGTPGSPATIAAPTRSAFQQDLIILRCILDATWSLRHAGLIAVINGATWGGGAS